MQPDKLITTGVVTTFAAAALGMLLQVSPKYSQGTRMIPAPLFWFGVGVTVELLRSAVTPSYSAVVPYTSPPLGVNGFGGLGCGGAYPLP